MYGQDGLDQLQLMHAQPTEIARSAEECGASAHLKTTVLMLCVSFMRLVPKPLDFFLVYCKESIIHESLHQEANNIRNHSHRNQNSSSTTFQCQECGVFCRRVL